MYKISRILTVLGFLWLAACQSVSGLGAQTAGDPTSAQDSQPGQPPSIITPSGDDAVQQQAEGELVVEIYSLPEVEVTTPEYPVRGKAPPGAVVSINDKIIVVGDVGAFEVSIPLVDGPNVIEIVASDQEGYQVEFVLVVTYVSESE